MYWLISYYFSTIQGRIDQVNQVLQLDKENSTGSRYNAIDKWSNQIQSLQMAVINKMAWDRPTTTVHCLSTFNR